MSPYASKDWSVSRFISQPRAFFSQSCAAIWLVVAILFVWHSCSAELLAVSVYNGKSHTVQVWLDTAQKLGETFGVDRHIRMIRGRIRTDVRRALEGPSDADEVAKPTGSDVFGGQ